MGRSKYTKYKAAIERLGFKQLDVYRMKDKEIIRLQRIADGRVYVVELPKRRDELTVDEFIKLIKEALARK